LISKKALKQPQVYIITQILFRQMGKNVEIGVGLHHRPGETLVLPPCDDWPSPLQRLKLVWLPLPALDRFPEKENATQHKIVRSRVQQSHVFGDIK
jgi:hypothetical protein